MRGIKLLVYMGDVNYQKRLVSYLRESKQIDFQINLTDSFEAVEMLLEKEHMDLLLTDNFDVLNKARLNKWQVIFFHSEVNVEGSMGEFPTIFKYQTGPQLLCELLSFLGGIIKKGSVSNQTRLLLVNSVEGGCGKTFQGFLIATALARMGQKVLYITLDYHDDLTRYGNWDSAQQGNKDLGDWLLQIKLNCQHFSISALSNGINSDNLTVFRRPKYSVDGYDIKETEWIKVLERLKEEGHFDRIVFEANQQFLYSNQMFWDDEILICKNRVDKLNQYIGMREIMNQRKPIHIKVIMNQSNESYVGNYPSLKVDLIQNHTSIPIKLTNHYCQLFEHGYNNDFFLQNPIFYGKVGDQVE